MLFKDKFTHIVNKNNSLVCVGLDIDKEKMPSFLFSTSKTPYVDFTTHIIDATKDLVCAYKLNMAFYEVLGPQGLVILQQTLEQIPRDIIVILDGKRNDIGNTSKKYAKTLFDIYNADAATVNPYLGIDGVKPFLTYHEKCSFILCRTSNPSASDFQDLTVGRIPMYQHVAKKIKEWNKQGTCGAVVGATYPKELQKIRRILGAEIPILIPGIGAQGGEVKQTVTYGTNNSGDNALLVSSRHIIYADASTHFAREARKKTVLLRDEINTYRK
jgi:orotidine-5'-phosphate decarboxylase